MKNLKIFAILIAILFIGCTKIENDSDCYTCKTITIKEYSNNEAIVIKNESKEYCDLTQNEAIVIEKQGTFATTEIYKVIYKGVTYTAREWLIWTRTNEWTANSDYECFIDTISTVTKCNLRE